MATSNIADVLSYLHAFVEGFDFTRPGFDQSLGRDLANKMVERIQMRSSMSVDPEGFPWAQNSTASSPWLPGGYKQWKEETYGWDDNPNYRTGQMLSQMSLFGRTRVSKLLIELVYGTGTAPTRSASPNGFFGVETDGKVTDIQKAEWAHMATGETPARRFYDSGVGDAESLCELARSSLYEYMRTSPYCRG